MATTHVHDFVHSMTPLAEAPAAHLTAALDGEAPLLLVLRHRAARGGQLRLQARQRCGRRLGLLLAGLQGCAAVFQLRRQALHLLMW